MHILKIISRTGLDAYLMGDFNVDLLKYPNNPCSSDSMCICASFAFLPMVSKPTRFTSGTISCIDNIFTNDLTSLAQSRTLVVDCSISDHYLILHVLDQPMPHAPTAYSYVKYKINDDNLCRLAQYLAQIDWSLVILSIKADHAFNEFYDYFMGKFYTHFPHINQTKRVTKDKPWFNVTL